MKPLLFPVFFILIIVCQGHAQDVLFPDLEGEDLVLAIQSGYTPSNLLALSVAKDLLYSEIDIKEGDSVRCVYSDHALYLPEGVDPSQWLYQNGIPDGINLEHTYPQSKGASAGLPGNSDMHHLFPTRLAVNERRASFPFGEITDIETTAWFYRDNEMASIPAANTDLYSEYKAGVFEPREAHKGNVARAVFYFYTIYRQDAISADPGYFDSMRRTLCGWHVMDPVDSDEMERNSAVAWHQGNTLNPFIMDCSLAIRCYCTDTDYDCDPTTHTDGIKGADAGVTIWVDHRRSLQIHITGTTGISHVALYDPAGQNVLTTNIRQTAHSEVLHIPLPDRLNSGIFFVSIRRGDRLLATKKIFLR